MKFNITITTSHIIVIALIVIALLVVYRIASKIVDVMQRKTTIEADKMLRDTNYKEEDIIRHLDYIITEAIDTYELFHIRTNNIFYINSKIENELLATVSDQVSNRISKTLMVQLSFIYSNDYIGEFIGSHIHLMVTEYVLNFNTNSAMEERIPPKEEQQRENK
jgi:hypothetical protein